MNYDEQRENCMSQIQTLNQLLIKNSWFKFNIIFILNSNYKLE
jgi:hypothetical protein